MKSSLRLAGAAVLCASLLLTACAKSHESSTSTTTDATKTTDTSIAATPGGGTSAPDTTTATGATAAPGEASTAAPAATTAADTTATTAAGTSGAGSMTFIEMPVYPGAAELKDQSMAMSANGSSVVIKAFSTKDDTKRVIDWYKSHLPASWKNFQLSSGDKTTGSFSNEGAGGDQTVIIATQDDKTTRVQLSTKHGK